MDKRSLIVLLLFGYTASFAQFKTEIRINAVYDASVKRNMEQGIKAMFIEINRAFDKKEIPKNPDQSVIDQNVINYFNTSWKQNRFKIVAKPQLSLVCLNLKSGGFQVRNIPIYFIEAAKGNRQAEIGFNFNENGKMLELFICIPEQTYSLIKIINHTVNDELRKESIILFLEKFRSAYNNSDSTFLEKVYSDNALIIVGKIVKEYTQQNEGQSINLIPTEKVVYFKTTKRDYINRLKAKFKDKEYINVQFSAIQIFQHPDSSKMNWYGVRLLQKWYSKKKRGDAYEDSGYLFLAINFDDINKPIIWVRTWEPDSVPPDKLFGFKNLKPNR